VDVDEEINAVKSSVLKNWKLLNGTQPDDSQMEYMNLVKNWHGFGSSMFNVTTKDPTLPKQLCIGVSYNDVSIYRRQDSRPLASFAYEHILQFGAPQANTYRIVVEGRDPITFETELVVEIAKLMKAYINEIVKTAKRQSMLLRDSLTVDAPPSPTDILSPMSPMSPVSPTSPIDSPPLSQL